MIPSLPQVARITSLIDESPRVRTVELDLRLEAEPGQFVMVWLPDINEKPFSLVRAEPITLTIARVGPFTDAVHRLGVGDRLWIRGPLGQPFRLPVRSQGPVPRARQGGGTTDPPPLLLVGGGYGVAPLHFLAERALAAGWGLRVIIGARTATDVIFVDRYATLGVRVAVATDDGSLGEKGVATDAAAQLLERQPVHTLYACGPEPMLDAAENLARDHGLPAQLSYERNMRCGIGVCGSCTRGGWLVCRDGPVRTVST